MARQRTGQEQRSPFVAAGLPQDPESHRRARLQRLLDTFDVVGRVYRLPVDLHDHIAAPHVDVLRERTRLYRADQHTVLLDAHVLAAGIGQVLDVDTEQGLRTFRRAGLFLLAVSETIREDFGQVGDHG